MKSQMRGRIPVKVGAVTVGGLLLATGLATPAQAWTHLQDECRWESSTMTLDVSNSGSRHDNWTSAAASWKGVDATVEVTDGGGDVQALTERRGNTVGWSGIARAAGTLDAMPPCANDRWQSGQMEIVLNDAKLGDYDSARINGIAAHEIGHALGLGHVPEDDAVLMHNYDERTVSTPQSDDKEGINAIY